MPSALRAVDLRASQTPVRHQGRRRTCAAFAATAAHEALAGGPDLSEEHAVWLGEQQRPTGEESAYVRDVLAGIRAEGQALSEDWPYGQPPFPSDPPAACADTARRRRSGEVRVDAASCVAAVGALLAAERAVILTLGVVPATWAAASRDGWLDQVDGPVRDGHAVLAVGVIPATARRPDAVIVKNSWGPRWGDAGFGFVVDAYLVRHHWYTDILERP